MFVDPPASADADANESFLPASLNSATGISDNTLLPEVVPPIQLCSNVAYDDLDGRPQGRNADSLASPEQCQVDQLLPSQSLIELSSTKHSYQSPANNSIPIVPSEAVTPEVREELPQASAERPGKSEFSKTEKIEPIPRDQVSPSSGSLVEATAVERWIPPALLALWKRGNRRQKLLLASAAVGCLWILVLILTLDVVHIDSSSGRSVGSGSVQRSTTPPAYSIASVGSAQTGPFQPPRASHA